MSGNRVRRQEETKDARQQRVILLPSWVAVIVERRAAAAASPESPLFPTRTGEWYGNSERLLRQWRESPEGIYYLATHGMETPPPPPPTSSGRRPVPHAAFTWKTFRRSAGTLVRSRSSAELAQQLWGHRNLATSEGHYFVNMPTVDIAAAAIAEEWGAAEDIVYAELEE